MTTELISVMVAVLAVGVTLSGVILTGLRGIRGEMRALRGELRGEMDQLRQEFRGEMDQLRQEFRGEMDQLRQELRSELSELRGELNEFRRDVEMRLSTVERQQAKLEGLLEGLREAVTGHKAA